MIEILKDYVAGTAVPDSGSGGGSDNAFNVDGYDWLGEITNDGELVNPTKSLNVVFDGVKSISSSWVKTKFKNDQRLVSMSFPDLETLETSNNLEAFLYNCSNLVSVSMPKVKIIGSTSFSEGCNNCSSLISVDLSGLEEVRTDGMSYAFEDCSNLKELKFGSLKIIGAGAFGSVAVNCENLEDIDFSTIEQISGSSAFYEAFYNCKKFETIRFTNLSTINSSGCFNSCFGGCTGIKDIYFNSLTSSSFGNYTNQFNNMLSNTGTSVVHNIHFPSSLQSTIESLSGYPTFGGTSGYVTVLFDLPATE